MKNYFGWAEILTVEFHACLPEADKCRLDWRLTVEILNKRRVIAGTVRDNYSVSVRLHSIRGGVYKIDDGTIRCGLPRKHRSNGRSSTLKENSNRFELRQNYGLGMMEDRRFKGK